MFAHPSLPTPSFPFPLPPLQITDPSVLKAYITQRTLFAKIMNEMESEGNRNAKTQSATLQVSRHL